MMEIKKNSFSMNKLLFRLLGLDRKFFTVLKIVWILCHHVKYSLEISLNIAEDI